MNFTTLESPCKWNHTPFVLLWWVISYRKSYFFLSNLDAFYSFFFLFTCTGQYWQHCIEEKWLKSASLSYSWSQRKSFQFFTTEYDISCRLFIYWLYYEGSFLQLLFGCFYHEGMLKLVKYFFCKSWDDHVFLFLHFVNLVCYVDFHMLNNSCISGINPAQSWCIILLNVLFNLVC